MPPLFFDNHQSAIEQLGFQSLTDPDKLLSLSFWRDEVAVTGWRCHVGHRATQNAGRNGIFRDYGLRVAAVVRD